MKMNWSARANQLREWLAPSRPSSPPAAKSKPCNVVWLVIAIVLTIFWQRTFEYAGSKLDLTDRITTVSELSGQDRFYCFYHCLGLYPLHAEGIEPIFSQEGAASIIRDHPEALRMEVGYLFRGGDPGKYGCTRLALF
jgi:hypothetical protein